MAAQTLSVPVMDHIPAIQIETAVGSGVPSGTTTIKTYDFTGRTVPLVSYT